MLTKPLPQNLRLQNQLKFGAAHMEKVNTFRRKGFRSRIVYLDQNDKQTV